MHADVPVHGTRCRDPVANVPADRQSRGMNIGDLVPDLPFVATDERAVRLSEFKGEAMVLVFMRHLG